MQQRPGNGGKMYGGVYRINEVQELKSLDPTQLNDAPSHHAVHQIAELLVDFDSSLAIQPELAARWEVSDDGLTYTYHIRQGVRFHDNPCFPGGTGRLLTAADVKYAFDRMLDARAGAKGASYFTDKVRGAREYYEATGAAITVSSADKAPTESATSAGNPDAARSTPKLIAAIGDSAVADEVHTAPKPGSRPVRAIPAEGVSGFTALDDSTFRVQLIKPFAAFKYYPALGFCYVYPREAVEKYGRDFYRNLVGTGPFVLDHWDGGRELAMKRNPHYWGHDSDGNQLPFLDGIRFTFIKDEKIQLTEFASGRLEEAYRIPSDFFRQVIGDDGRLTPEYSMFQLHKVPALSTQYYGMLVPSKEFGDRRVRQAFNYAIDREKIVRFVLQGQALGPATHGLVPPSMPGYPIDRIKGYTFDLNKARALMAEAGYPGGKGFPPITIQLNAGGGRNKEVAEAMQAMLSTGLGVKIDIKILEWPQHLELLELGNAPLFRLGWIADYPDPENFLNLFYSATIPPSGPSSINSTRYRNRTFDSLFVLALGTQDDAQRLALYAQAEQVAVDDAPMLFIYNDLDYRLVQPWVQDYTSNPMDRRDFTRAWFSFNDKKKSAGL